MKISFLNKIKSKNISGIFLIVFIMNTLSGFSYSNNLSIPNTQNLLLPSFLGNVADSFNGNTNKTIYCIQDLHCDPDTQIKIRDMISLLSLNMDFKRRLLIGVEGTEGEIKTDIFNSIVSRDFRDEMISALTVQGYLNGAELYKLKNSKQTLLMGLEDKETYDKDFNHLFGCLLKQDSYNKIFNDVEKHIKKAKHEFYNYELKEMEYYDSMIENQEISFEDYIYYLNEKAVKVDLIYDKEYPIIAEYVRMLELKNKINLDAVKFQTQVLIKRLEYLLSEDEITDLKLFSEHKDDNYYLYLDNILREKNISYSNQFPAFASYSNYLNIKRNVNVLRFIQETSRLSFKVKILLAKDDINSINIIHFDYYLRLFEKMLDNEAGIKDVEEWNAVRDEFYDIAHRLGAKYPVLDGIDKNNKYLKNADENMREFYRLAHKRSEYIVNNMINLMNGDKYDNGILLTGGYHIQDITNILKAKGISYHVITPVVEKTYNKELYIERLYEYAEYRNSKLGTRNSKQIRNPKSETNPKLEIQKLSDSGFLTLDSRLANHTLLIESILKTGIINEKLIEEAVGNMSAVGMENEKIVKVFEYIKKQYHIEKREKYLFKNIKRVIKEKLFGRIIKLSDKKAAIPPSKEVAPHLKNNWVKKLKSKDLSERGSLDDNRAFSEDKPKDFYERCFLDLDTPNKEKQDRLVTLKSWSVKDESELSVQEQEILKYSFIELFDLNTSYEMSLEERSIMDEYKLDILQYMCKKEKYEEVEKIITESEIIFDLLKLCLRSDNEILQAISASIMYKHKDFEFFVQSFKFSGLESNANDFLVDSLTYGIIYVADSKVQLNRIGKIKVMFFNRSEVVSNIAKSVFVKVYNESKNPGIKISIVSYLLENPSYGELDMERDGKFTNAVELLKRLSVVPEVEVEKNIDKYRKWLTINKSDLEERISNEVRIIIARMNEMGYELSEKDLIGHFKVLEVLYSGKEEKKNFYKKSNGGSSMTRLMHNGMVVIEQLEEKNSTTKTYDMDFDKKRGQIIDLPELEGLWTTYYKVLETELKNISEALYKLFTARSRFKVKGKGKFCRQISCII